VLEKGTEHETTPTLGGFGLREYHGF